MTKKDKIKEAYGEHWEYFKDKQFDENGYSMFEEKDDKHKIWEQITLDSHPYANRVYRPSLLKGIENNNGWIKIESESDLPKGEFCYFIPCGKFDEAFMGWVDVNFQEVFFIDFSNYGVTKAERGYASQTNAWLVSQITHYQQIQKPLPPLY